MHRIRSLCSQNAAAPRPGSLPAINQLWSVLYRYMNNSIRIVNHFIDNQFSIGMRLKSIANLLSVEVCFLLLPRFILPWRLLLQRMVVEHIGFALASARPRPLGHCQLQRGCLYCGSNSQLPSASSFCSPVRYLTPLVSSFFRTATAPLNSEPPWRHSYSMVGNTTSPVDDQIGEFRDWPDADVLQIYTHTFDVDFPCPSRLFLAVRHLSHVRVEAAAAAPAMMRRLLSAATRIADEIGRFSPEDWTERYEIPPRPLSYLLGRVFKTAVTLFAFLALPRVLSRPFLSVEATHGTDPRIHHRSVLTRLLVEAYATRLEKDGWCWPLAVLGVALHDGTAAEQAAVLGLLDEISAPGAYCGPAMLSILLPEFWASGKTGWDDCFRKASQVLA